MSDLTNSNNIMKRKVVVVGDMAVGKTSLAVRYTKDSFLNNYQQTVGASFYSRCVEVCGSTVMFQIWDTAGQERFRSLVPMYLRDAHIAIIMYDITSMDSFRNINHWLQELILSAPSEVRITLVGNKCDLHEHRQVQYEVGKSFASKKNLAFIETSARSGYNVDTLFYDLAREVFVDEEYHRRPAPVCDSIDIFDDEPKEQKRSKCCKS